MDFWSRLIGGSRSLSSKSLRTTTPVERLAAFKRTCNTLQQIWRTNSTPTGETSVTTHARNCIERLNSVLSDESRGPAPHPCVAYAATSQVYVTVTKLALSSYDPGMLRCAAVFFSTLIDSEVDSIVDNRLFARALVDLVRRAEPRTEEVEGRLVELLFAVANSIRLQPAILPAWFNPRSSDGGNRPSTSSDSRKIFAGATRKDDFPLFYLLLDHVHREGRAGDFARTGLLYIIETASRSEILEKWLIESDLAALMATGLGALYSQLGSLPFAVPDTDLPKIIALSDYSRHGSAVQPHLGTAMDAFMSYLLFWQDTIDHCRSAEVHGTLLDHFQVLFLEQLLYPSLLESSDVEGGSTSAVLTYLCRILESIDQSDLVYSILHFLLASPSDIDSAMSSSKQETNISLSRRKSLDALTAMAEVAANPSPSLFNLRDLALLGLQSTNEQTVLATLRLLTVILQRHPSFANLLIRTIPGRQAKERAVGAFNAELQQLLSMATSVMEDPTVDVSYENYLKDALETVESLFGVQLSTERNYATEDSREPLELREDDPIMRELLGCLETFFTNSVIVNLSLTEILVSIASSHLVSLDGWLLVDPSKYKYATESSLANSFSLEQTPAMEALRQIRLAYEEPSWSSTDAPVLTVLLQKLVQQVEKWRKDVPDFDILVAARRDLLHQEDEAPIVPTPSRQQTDVSSAHQESPRGPFPIPRDILSDERPSPQGSSYLGSPPPGSPAQQQPPSRSSSTSRAAAAEELRKRLSMPFPVTQPSRETAIVEERASSQTDPPESAEQTETLDSRSEMETATLGHVLTNVVILYEFLLELTAVVQVRGNLFEEAGYPGVVEEVNDS